MAGARRGAEEGRHGAPSADQRRAIAPLDGEPEHDHAARVGVAGADALRARRLRLRSRSLARRRTGRAAWRRARAAGPLERVGPFQLGENLRLKGLPHRHLARRQGQNRRRGALCPRRRCAPGQARSRSPHPGVRQGGSRRPHPGRHRPERLQRDVRLRIRRAREARRTCVGAVHMG